MVDLTHLSVWLFLDIRVGKIGSAVCAHIPLACVQIAFPVHNYLPFPSPFGPGYCA